MAKFVGCLNKGTEGEYKLWYDCISKYWFWSNTDSTSIKYETQEKAEDAYILEEIEWGYSND